MMVQLDPGIEPPTYAYPGDAGADLRTTEDFELGPGERRLVGTGIAIALPAGYAAFVHPRSGLAARHGISIVNAPGTVDAGYRGEVSRSRGRRRPGGRRTVLPRRPDRAARGPARRTARFVPVAALDETARGIGGYGSTGGILDSSAAHSPVGHSSSGQVQQGNRE